MRAEFVNKKLNIENVIRIINDNIGILNQFVVCVDNYDCQIISKKKCQKQVKNLYDVLAFLNEKTAKANNNTIINYFCCNPEEYPEPTVKGDAQIYNFYKK